MTAGGWGNKTSTALYSSLGPGPVPDGIDAEIASYHNKLNNGFNNSIMMREMKI